MPSRAKAIAAKKATTTTEKPKVDVKATLKAARGEPQAAKPRYSPEVLRQWTQAKTMHPGAIVLFRHDGAFFDALDDDAQKLVDVLGLKYQPDGDVRFVSFPAGELEERLALLVRAGLRVAICEPTGAEKMAEVARVVDPESGMPDAGEPEAASEEPAAEVKVDAKPEVRTVNLDDVEVDSDMNPRDKLRTDVIADYAEKYKDGQTSRERPVLFDDGEKLWLASGFHRCPAAQDAGKKKLKFDVYKGTKQDAAMYAAACNQEHGVYRSTDDKQKAIRIVLGVHPEWTDRAVAKYVGVGHPMVARVRAELESSGIIFHCSTRIASDGREVPATQPERPEPKETTSEDHDSDDHEEPTDTEEHTHIEPPLPPDFGPPDDPPAPPESATAEPDSPPADSGKPIYSAAGNWSWVDPVNPKQKSDCEIKVDAAGVVTGTVGTSNIDRAPTWNGGSCVGGKLVFWCTRQPIDDPGVLLTTKYSGVVTADHIIGEMVLPDKTKVRWEAKREIERLARDLLGRELPSHLKPAFRERAKIMESAQLISKGANALAMADQNIDVGGYLKTRPHLRSEPMALASFIRKSLAPFCVCPICNGDGDAGQCLSCTGRGWMSRRQYDDAAAPVQERARSFKPGDSFEQDDTPDDGPLDTGDPTRYVPAGPGLDPTGHEIPRELRDLFAADWLQDEARRLDRFLATLRSSTTWLHWLKPQALESGAAFVQGVRDCIPFAVCRKCDGKGCGECLTSGCIPKWVHDNAEAKKKANKNEKRQEAKGKK